MIFKISLKRLFDDLKYVFGVQTWQAGLPHVPVVLAVLRQSYWLKLPLLQSVIQGWWGCQVYLCGEMICCCCFTGKVGA